MLCDMSTNREAPAKSKLGLYLAGNRGRVAVRRAAARVEALSHGAFSVSEGRWRQIEAGFESKGGLQIPVNPKPETVVWMCRAVDADPEEGLRLAGFAPGDYPELLDSDQVGQSGNPIRDAISTDPKLGRWGRESVLDVYDREVEREVEARRRTG